MIIKRTIPSLLAVCMLPLAVVAPSVKAASSSSSSGALDVNFFYDNLKNDGSWFNTTEYGDVWQPYIAYKSEAWRPYTDGYWSYTDGGWMFVSYEDFGWAVYHYGRWTQLKDIGWAWVPGTEWAPAWVTWRESNPDGTAAQPGPDSGQQPPANVAATTTDANPDQNGGTPNGGNPPPPAPAPAGDNGGGAPGVSQNYVGWAPLPPDPGPTVYNEGYAYGPTVDVDYGIDPYDYSFVDARFFGAPYLGAVLFDPFRSYYCCDHSVNVSNFYYNGRGGYRGFYNGGPRYERFQGVSERQIPRYNINRAQGRAAQQAVQAGRFNQINGNRINVAAPRFSQRNVRDGRVNFTSRGTLPVTRVGQDRPVNPANNEARQRAQNTFRQQGDAFRSQHPNEPSVRRGAQLAARREATQPGANPGARPEIATTPRAQQEERAARQEARQEGPERNPAAGPSGNPAAATRAAGQPENRAGEAANPSVNRAAGRAEGQESGRRDAAEAQRPGGENKAAASGERQQARQASRSSRHSGGSSHREARQSRGDGGGGGGHRGGGGGEHRGGGGGGTGEHRSGGGGGGHARAGGGGGHGGGHDGGGGKKH